MAESQALIFVRNKRNTRYQGKYGRVARYAAIQHALPAGREYFNRGPILSGDAKWLFTVMRELRKTFGVKVRGHVQRFIREGKSGPIERWLPDWERRVKRLQNRALDEPIKQAQLGVQIARQIVPKSSGALLSAIDYKKIKNKR